MGGLSNLNLDLTDGRVVDQLEEAMIELSRTDSAIFTQYVFGYRNAPFHNMWHRWIDQGQSGLILSYRGSGKSEQLTGRILWELGNNPDVRIKIATESGDLSKSILFKISSTIVDNERFKKVFPNVKPDRREWSSTRIRIERKKQLRDPTIAVSGVLTAKTGGRCDLLYLDDVVGMRNGLLQPKLRPVVSDTVFSNWFPMLDGDQAKWFCIGTPWHIEDLITQFRTNPEIAKAPEVKVGPNFESPWPERHTAEYFKGILRQYGRISFNRGYRLIAISSDETWINKDVLMQNRDFTLSAKDIANNQNYTKFMGVDLGHRTGAGSSPTVIFTTALAENGVRIPCDIRVSRDASPLNIARVIFQAASELNPAIIFVENVGAQQYLVDMMNQLGPQTHRIEGYFTASQKMDLKTGVPSLLAELEGGKWKIPYADGGGREHDITCLCNYCKWMGEICDFPNGTIDYCMANWLSLMALRKLKGEGQGGFSVWTYSR